MAAGALQVTGSFILTGKDSDAVGVVVYYPTGISMHHRSKWLGNYDSFGYLLKGCRDMGMSVIARTDPHATWQNVFESHPDF